MESRRSRQDGCAGNGPTVKSSEWWQRAVSGCSGCGYCGRHDVSANLLFNGVRSAGILSLGPASDRLVSAACLAPEPSAPIVTGDFIQLGVVTDAPTMIGRSGPRAPTKLSSVQPAAIQAKTRAGLIEMSLQTAPGRGSMRLPTSGRRTG